MKFRNLNTGRRLIEILPYTGVTRSFMVSSCKNACFHLYEPFREFGIFAIGSKY